jgi:hypothetical protein
MVSRASHVPDLQEERLPDALFYVQVVIIVVGIPEILAHREKIEYSAAKGGSYCASIWAGSAARWEDSYAGLPRWSDVRSDGVHRTATCWIPFDAVGSAV